MAVPGPSCSLPMEALDLARLIAGIVQHTELETSFQHLALETPESPISPPFLHEFN